VNASNRGDIDIDPNNQLAKQLGDIKWKLTQRTDRLPSPMLIFQWALSRVTQAKASLGI
jgi:hypothetical protein